MRFYCPKCDAEHEIDSPTINLARVEKRFIVCPMCGGEIFMAQDFVSCPKCAFYAVHEGTLCPEHEFVKPETRRVCAICGLFEGEGKFLHSPFLWPASHSFTPEEKKSI
jgi:ribosomal protein S27AE